MKPPEHMIWRKTGKKTGMWYYDRRWPVDVQTAVGEPRHKRSLGTAHFDEGKRRFLAKEAWFDATVINARQGNPTGTEYDSLRQQRATDFTKARRNEKKYYTDNASAYLFVEDKDGNLVPSNYDPENHALEDTFAYVSNQGLEKEVSQLEKEKLVGTQDPRLLDSKIEAIQHIINGTAPKSEPKPSKLPLFSEFAKEHLEEVKGTIGEKAWFKREHDFKEFQTVIGDRPIDLYKLEAGRAYYKYMKAHIGRGKTTPLAPKSIKIRLFHITTFFREARKNYGESVTSPVEGFKAPRKQQNQKPSRRAYKREEINKIFKALDKDSDLYWPVMLAFYTGLRQQAIVQLAVEDIDINAKLPCMDIHDGDINKAKNPYSTFILPIHKTLLKHGFLKFVKGKKKGRLFPAYTWGKRIGAKGSDLWGRRVGGDYADFLEEQGIKIPELTYHSIRHGFTAECREADVPDDTRRWLQGRAESGSGGGYAEERKIPSPAVLLPYLNKVKYGIEIEK